MTIIKEKIISFINSDERGLICFDRKHIRLIIFLLCFFVLAILFRLHGYSISMWRNFIDGSSKKEILLGEERGIRSDDCSVEIPLMLAQLSHDPKYPMVNKNIATGLNMIPHSKVPIRHVLTFFRPTVWGFFVGADFGLSYMWQTMVFGLFYVFFLVFMIISRNDFYLSLMGSLFLLYSSFFQFWSFHMAEIPIFMGLIFISFSYLCFSRKKITIMAHAIILGWTLSCYTLNFVYPPYQVSCAYLLLFMMLAIIADRYREYDMRANGAYRIAGIVIALLIFAYAGITYYITSKDIIKIMMSTVYPGQRFSVGGNLNFGILFRNFFFTFIYITYITHTKIDWGVFKNICEASSFLFFFPPIIAAIIWQTISQRKISNKFSVIMTGYFVILLLYIFVGFHPAISKYSLFYLMPSSRSIIGLGIADVIIMVSFLSDSHKTNRTEQIIISCLWFICLCVIGKQFGKNFEQPISFLYIGAVSIITGFLTYYLLNTEKKKTAIALLVGISFISTYWFNPVVSRGTSFIYENDLSKKILEINKNENGNTQWATFGYWAISNLFRMIGVKSVNGTHSYPLFDVWEKIDPQRQYVSEYNRYANIEFISEYNRNANIVFRSFSTDKIRFRSPRGDKLFVYIDPSSDVLNKMGVTHILALDEDIAAFENNKNFIKLWEVNNRVIYKVNKN